jgi:hypothetical protein
VTTAVAKTASPNHSPAPTPKRAKKSGRTSVIIVVIVIFAPASIIDPFADELKSEETCGEKVDGVFTPDPQDEFLSSLRSATTPELSDVRSSNNNSACPISITKDAKLKVHDNIRKA